MTTNAEIKAMFNQLMAKQEEILAAANAPLPAALTQERRIVRTFDINGNMAEFSPNDIWFKFGMVQTIPGDPTRGKPFTRLMFRYTNMGRMFSIDLWGTPDQVAKAIGGIEPEVVEAIQPGTIMLRVPSTVAPTAAETLAVSSCGPTVTDKDGHVWSIGPDNVTLRDNENFGDGRGTEYAILGGNVYVLGIDSPPNWYIARPEGGWTNVGPDLPTS